MEKALETICINVKILREKKKLTQPGLAELAKINLKTLQRVEQKLGSPSWATVQLIATALGVEAFSLSRPLPIKK